MKINKEKEEIIMKINKEKDIIDNIVELQNDILNRVNVNDFTLELEKHLKKKDYDSKSYFLSKRLTLDLDSPNKITTIDGLASGFQMVGGLIGSENILRKCNVLQISKDEKNDLYAELTNDILNMYDKNIDESVKKLTEQEEVVKDASDKAIYKRKVLDHFSSSFKNERQLFLNLDKKKKNYSSKIDLQIKISESEQDYLKVLCRNYISRDNIKGFMMRHIYSEGDYARKLAIKEYFKNEYEDQDVTKYNEKNLFYFAEIINSYFLKCLYEKFPEVVNFSTLITIIFEILIKDMKVLDRENQFRYILRGDLGFSSLIFFPVFEIKRFSSQLLNGKRTQSSYLTPTSRLDEGKFIRSCIPNAIHFLDSEIVRYVVNRCIYHGIKITTIHDAFRVKNMEAYNIKLFYFEGILRHVMKANNVENFLISNGCKYIIRNNEFIQNELNNFENNKKEILAKLQNGSLKMSPYILAP